MSKPDENSQAKALNPFRAFIASIIEGLGVVVTFCGVPGICVLILLVYIINQVSPERKQEFVDAVQYIIKSEKATLLVIYFVISFLAVLYAYNSYWMGREKLLKKRIRKLESSNININQ